MKENKREIDWTKYPEEKRELHGYYRSLGYDERTASVLTLFTFGNGGWRAVKIDRLYEAILERGSADYDEGPMPCSAGYAAPAYAPERAAYACSAPVPQKGPRSGKLSVLSSIGESVSKGFSAKRSAPAKASADVSYSDSLDVPQFLSRPSKKASPRANTEASPRASAEASPRAYAMNASFDESETASEGSLFGGMFSGAYANGVRVMPATDEYEPIEEKGFRNVAEQMTSTFRMTTNTASAGILFNQLREDRRIDRSMVRIEEMLAYFRYKSVLPDTEKFRISCELMPVADCRKLLYINVQGKEEVKQCQNIVLLLDVSGSMCGNTEQVQAMVATILSKLKEGDKVSLVTYSSRDRVVINGLKIRSEKDRIRALEEFLGVDISGCTYGSAGIEKAYEIGKAEFIEGGNNQVILITDGDLNFGITDKGGLAELIEEKKKSNLFLSVIGTGLYNYKDDKLETLCKHGNGVYRVVNNLADVKKSIDTGYASLVNVIAKDVKAQVEFNPEVVESFRLLGYENREIGHEDFANDKVISEPFGSGGYGVALYELVLRDGSKPVESGYRYAKVVTTGSSELGTVKVRYKEPLEDSSTEIEYVISSADDSFTDNLRLAYVVYVCAEKLRDSDKIGAPEKELARKLCNETGAEIRDMNKDDFYKLPEILKRTEGELNVGIRSGNRFKW